VMPLCDLSACCSCKQLLLIRFSTVGFVAFSSFAVVKVSNEPDSNVHLENTKGWRDGPVPG